MEKKTKIILGSFILILFFSGLVPFIQAKISCEDAGDCSGCWCTGNVFERVIGYCCVMCRNEWWFGKDDLFCCAECNPGGGGKPPIYPEL